MFAYIFSKGIALWVKVGRKNFPLLALISPIIFLALVIIFIFRSYFKSKGAPIDAPFKKEGMWTDRLFIGTLDSCAAATSSEVSVSTFKLALKLLLPSSSEKIPSSCAAQLSCSLVIKAVEFFKIKGDAFSI